MKETMKLSVRLIYIKKTLIMFILNKRITDIKYDKLLL